MSKKNLFISIVIIACILIVVFTISMDNNQKNLANDVRYVALGDSYTIGEGASEKESWPAILTDHLKQDGIDIELVANPSVTGWTTQDVIDQELSIYESANPTFATLLIGVNDWVRGTDKKTFQSNLVLIIDRMQANLPDKSKLILVTIPDFSATPNGKRYSNGRDISKGIYEFNEIIKEEGAKRNLPVVDIYAMSKEMAKNPELVASDGLHPSAKEYALWETLIYPVAEEMLR